VAQTDKAWEHFGRDDPYHGVLTNDAFKKERFDDDARARFFKTGEDYVELVLSVVRDHLSPGFVPERALDFGCGVGRLTVALARRTEETVGVDISPAMLAEAARNAELAGLTNVRVVASDDRLSQVPGTFDLVHSFIVFQHIRPDRGEALIGRLIELLRDDGIGVLQLTYANASGTPWRRRAMTAAYERVPFAYAVRNLVKREPARKPPMHMSSYELSRVLRLLQEGGCHDVHVRFTETSHYGYPIYGAILFFAKRRLDVSRYG